ncbi:MAG: DUF3857 domain-containing protein [Marinoscillum sp.]
MTKLLTVLLLTVSINLAAQKAPIKFGKVSEEELEMTECSFYPEANSMTLASFGDLRFFYNDQKNSFQLKIQITERIKVFNTLDKDAANISIRYYDPVKGSNKESISGLKAFTYNLVDGKVEKTKLPNSEEFVTRISDYRSEVSFAMPDVREGSVIEYQYDVTSDFISNLYEWKFQTSRPTLHSEFRYVIPEYYHYTSSQVGNFVPLEREELSERESFTYSWEQQGSGGNVTRGKSTLTSNSKKYVYVAKELLPLIDEPFMNNKPNLPTRLEFQLMSRKMPGQMLKVIAGNYDEFNETLMESSSFGSVLNKGNFAKDKIATLEGDDTEKAIALYKWLQGHFAYNGNYGVVSSTAGKSAFNDAKGDVADINLTLIAAYREAGLNANPVILSTRGHGIPHPVYPSYEDFNYTIAAVQTDKGLFLTDASTSLPFGVLPVRCLNGQGWMANEEQGQWVSLKNNATHTTTTMSTYTITEDELQVNTDVKYTDYAALEEGKQYKDDKTGYEENIIGSYPESEVSGIEVVTEDNEIRLKFDVVKYHDGDIIYLQPVQGGAILENPFKREERQSSIDWPYGFNKTTITRITLPEGYIAETPEAANVALPDKAGRFLYSVNQMGNTLNIMSTFKLDRTDFSAQDYPMLKQFYQIVADKNNEMVVIKKQ